MNEGAPTVTLVCGPPGAGKTSYVMARAEHGDLILDVDRLFEALSGLPAYDTPDELLPFVMEARNAVLKRLARRHKVRHAWVVMCGANVRERQALRDLLRAEVVVLEVAADECVRRITADARRQGRGDMWKGLVEEWWREYGPWPTDTVLKADHA